MCIVRPSNETQAFEPLINGSRHRATRQRDKTMIVDAVIGWFCKPLHGQGARVRNDWIAADPRMGNTCLDVASSLPIAELAVVGEVIPRSPFFVLSPQIRRIHV